MSVVKTLIYVTTKREHLTHIHILHDFFFTPFAQLAGCAHCSARTQGQTSGTSIDQACSAETSIPQDSPQCCSHDRPPEQSGTKRNSGGTEWNKSQNKSNGRRHEDRLFHGTCGAPCDEPFCDLLRSDGPRPEARPTWGAGGERSPPLHASQQWNRQVDARCLRQWYMTTVLQHLVDSNVFCRDVVLNSRPDTSPTCAFIKRARSTSCSSLLTSHSCASHSREKMGA